MTASDYALNLIKSSVKSINAIANDAGIPPSTLYSFVNGKCRNIGVNTLYLISVYGLGIPLSEFFSGIDDKLIDGDEEK